MARLQGSKRPIVVSFRRHVDSSEVSAASTSTEPEVYVSLEELTLNSSKMKKNKNKTYLSVLFRHSRGTKEIQGPQKPDLCSRLDVPFESHFIYTPQEQQTFNLLPTSLSNGAMIAEKLEFQTQKENKTEPIIIDNQEMPEYSLTGKKYPKVEDIEIFQEQYLKIQSSFKKSYHSAGHNRRRPKIYKPPNASSSSFEYYYQEPCGQSDSKHNLRKVRIDSEHEVKFCNVPRSSTVPSFQNSVSKSQGRFEPERVHDFDISTESLQNSIAFNNLGNSFHNNYLRNKCRGKLTLEVNGKLEGKNYKTSEGLDGNIISNSKPTVVNHHQITDIIGQNSFKENPTNGIRSKYLEGLGIGYDRIELNVKRDYGIKDDFEHMGMNISADSGDEKSDNLGKKDDLLVASSNDTFVDYCNGNNMDEPEEKSGNNEFNADDLSNDLHVPVPTNSKSKSCSDLASQTRSSYNVLPESIHPSLTDCNLAS